MAFRLTKPIWGGGQTVDTQNVAGISTIETLDVIGQAYFGEVFTAKAGGYFAGKAIVADATPSTSPTTGALQVVGGVGIGGELHVLNQITTLTAPAGTNTTQVATTAFVQTAISTLVGSAPEALNTLAELSTALGSDPNFATSMATTIGAKAPLASPAFTGNPTVPDQPTTDFSQRAANTKFVNTYVGEYSDYVDLTYAKLASPVFTGTPTVPDQATSNYSQRIANTKFVNDYVGAFSAHVDATFAKLASPALTGNPTAPTQATGNRSTRLANTQYVGNEIDSYDAYVEATYQKMATSDRNLKSDFRAASTTGAIIDALQVLSYDLQGESERQVGLIAQDAYKVWSQPIIVGSVVDPDARDVDITQPGFTPWRINHAAYVPLLIEEIQSLRRRVAQLESRTR